MCGKAWMCGKAGKESGFLLLTYWYFIEARSTQESLRWMEGRSTILYENSLLLLLFSVGMGERKVSGRKVYWRFIEASGQLFPCLACFAFS